MKGEDWPAVRVSVLERPEGPASPDANGVLEQWTPARRGTFPSHLMISTAAGAMSSGARGLARRTGVDQPGTP